jgi:hypothetical protein
MKTASATSPLNLPVLLVALLFAALIFTVATGRKIPFITNIQSAMVVLLVLGMTMCALGGIGRVSALGQWTHPLSILGYLVGVLILVIGIATIFGWKLPYIQNDVQAVIIVSILTAAKIIFSVLHSLLVRS